MLEMSLKGWVQWSNVGREQVWQRSCQSLNRQRVGNVVMFENKVLLDGHCYRNCCEGITVRRHCLEWRKEGQDFETEYMEDLWPISMGIWWSSVVISEKDSSQFLRGMTDAQLDLHLPRLIVAWWLCNRTHILKLLY